MEGNGSVRTEYPIISVVIPTYNRGDLISKAIDSILGQTYQNFEIIIVDNKSTDNTAEVVAGYNDQRITYLVNDRNYERSYSRNRGFDNAKGDLITLLDSDDILYQDCLQDAVIYAVANPDCRVFHYQFDFVNEEYKPIGASTSKEVANPLKELMKGNYISNIAVFYRKEVIEKVRFDETPILIGVEDYDFVVRVLAETRRIDKINKVNAGVLFHPNRSVNLEKWDRTYERIQYFISKSLRSKSFNQAYGPYRSTFTGHLNLYLSGFLAVRGRSAEAFKFLMKALGEKIGLLFTIKFWKHFLLIFKYITK
jgi:glycosyltransferase involved in cell wall biosynthesis